MTVVGEIKAHGEEPITVILFKQSILMYCILNIYPSSRR